MTPLIQISNLYKSYPPGQANEVQALNNVSLTIEKSEFTAIVGKSGSGKSTLLHILGCLDTATSGCYRLNGVDVFAQSSGAVAQLRNQKIGFVLQEFGLLLNRTVYENVAVPLYFSKTCKTKEMPRRIEPMLDRLGLLDKRRQIAGELSGGQKQRVAIARAMINQPELLLADEPTGALDTKTAGEIMDLFHRLNGQGVTVIMVTHNLELASGCKRKVQIEDGKILD